VDWLVIVDIAAERKENLPLVDKIKEDSEILVIDHHPPRNSDLTGPGVIHINPHFTMHDQQAAKYSASKLVFDVCSLIVDLQDLSWIGAIGIAGDNRSKYWRDFFKEVCKSFPSLRVEGKRQDVVLKRIADIIDSGPECASLEGSRISFQALLNVELPEDILNGSNPHAKRLLKWYDKIMTQMEEMRKAWKANIGVEYHKNLELKFFEIRPGADIHSKIATELSNENPNLTIIVVSRSNGITNLSFRRQGGEFNCGKLARESIISLTGARGGGHWEASGATIQTKDIVVFKQQAIQWIRNNKGSL